MPQKPGPWASGSFYLAVVIVIGVLLAAAANLVPLLALPLVVTGALLAVAIIGALQLRQDENLGEKNFVELMGLALRRLPFTRGDNPKQAQEIEKPNSPALPTDKTE